MQLPPADRHVDRAKLLQRILEQLLDATDLLTTMIVQELWEVYHEGEERPRRPPQR